jgi:hypothetical protein
LNWRGKVVCLPASGGKRTAIKPRKMSEEHIVIVFIGFGGSKPNFDRKLKEKMRGLECFFSRMKEE